MGLFNSQKVILLLNNCFLECKAYDSTRHRETAKPCVGALRAAERQCARGNVILLKVCRQARSQNAAQSATPKSPQKQAVEKSAG